MSALTELIAIEEEDRLSREDQRDERHIKRLHIDPATMPIDTGRSAGWHRHQCPKCRHIWGHDGAFLQTLSDGLFYLAHRCPKCNTFSDADDGTTICLTPTR